MHLVSYSINPSEYILHSPNLCNRLVELINCTITYRKIQLIKGNKQPINNIIIWYKYEDILEKCCSLGNN